jgi:hypothetical protein
MTNRPEGNACVKLHIKAFCPEIAKLFISGVVVVGGSWRRLAAVGAEGSGGGGSGAGDRTSGAATGCDGSGSFDSRVKRVSRTPTCPLPSSGRRLVGLTGFSLPINIRRAKGDVGGAGPDATSEREREPLRPDNNLSVVSRATGNINESFDELLSSGFYGRS